MTGLDADSLRDRFAGRPRPPLTFEELAPELRGDCLALATAYAESLPAAADALLAASGPLGETAGVSASDDVERATAGDVVREPRRNPTPTAADAPRPPVHLARVRPGAAGMLAAAAQAWPGAFDERAPAAKPGQSVTRSPASLPLSRMRTGPPPLLVLDVAAVCGAVAVSVAEQWTARRPGWPGLSRSPPSWRRPAVRAARVSPPVGRAVLVGAAVAAGGRPGTVGEMCRGAAAGVDWAMRRAADLGHNDLDVADLLEAEGYDRDTADAVADWVADHESATVFLGDRMAALGALLWRLVTHLDRAAWPTAGEGLAEVFTAHQS
ncbi:MAG: hypothetical protein WKF73_01190 [Nocardioidaceae bacterium]